MELLNKQESKIITDSIIINNDEWKYFTIFDFINSERLPDGYEELRAKDWILVVKYNDDKIIELSFDFEIHNKSKKIPTAWRYSGFTD